MVRRVTHWRFAAQAGWETGPNCRVREFSNGGCVLPNLRYGVPKLLSILGVLALAQELVKKRKAGFLVRFGTRRSQK